MVTECLLTPSLVTPSHLLTSNSDYSLPVFPIGTEFHLFLKRIRPLLCSGLRGRGMNWCLAQKPRHWPEINSHKWVLCSYTIVCLPHIDLFKATSGHRAWCQRKWLKRCSSYCGCFLWVQRTASECNMAHLRFGEGQGGPYWGTELIWC